jgi:hypothetical protein
MQFRLGPVAAVAALSIAPIACAVPAADETSDATESEIAVASTTYVRLEALSATSATVSRVNGGKLTCPSGARATRCIVDAVELPADCDWECKDGVLSLRGVTVLRGRFASKYDSAAHKTVTSFVAAAAFDTFDSTLGTKPVYRVKEQTVFCKKAPCPKLYEAVTVNDGTTASGLTNVDFSAAHDTNYVLDPARGFAQIARPEGLLVTGSTRRGVFKADRVFRQWSPIADCDVLGAARAYYFHPAGTDEVNLEFATTAEAEQYQDPTGRTVHWLVRTENKGTAVAFTGGVNDLWAQTFDVSTTTCAVTLTGEH